MKKIYLLLLILCVAAIASLLSFHAGRSAGEKRGRHIQACEGMTGEGSRCRMYSIKGKVISAVPGGLIVLDRGESERTLTASEKCVFENAAALSEIKAGDFVFAAGCADEQGLFCADLIRKK